MLDSIEWYNGIMDTGNDKIVLEMMYVMDGNWVKLQDWP